MSRPTFAYDTIFERTIEKFIVESRNLVRRNLYGFVLMFDNDFFAIDSLIENEVWDCVNKEEMSLTESEPTYDSME